VVAGDVPLPPPEPQVPVALAYLPLPKEKGPLREAVATWTPADLEEADEAARDVVRWLRTVKEIPFDPQRSRRKARDGLATLLGQGLLQLEGGEE
jgi:hypothetical protein